MLKPSTFFLVLIIFSACKTKTSDHEANEQLITFHSHTIMGMDQLVEAGDENYQKIDSKEFNLKTDTIQFTNNKIYVSYLAIVNGCGQYAGDIEIRKDSLFLKLVDISGIGCTHERCDRLVYTIRNPENKQYKIIKR